MVLGMGASNIGKPSEPHLRDMFVCGYLKEKKYMVKMIFKRFVLLSSIISPFPAEHVADALSMGNIYKQ